MYSDYVADFNPYLQPQLPAPLGQSVDASRGSFSHKELREKLAKELKADTISDDENWESASQFGPSESEAPSEVQSDIGSQVRVELKDALTRLTKIEDLIKQYSKHLSKLREAKTILRRLVVSLMDQNNIENANLENNKYCLKTNHRKENPLVRKKLPENLAKFFEQHEKLNSQKAKEKAEFIINWILENAATLKEIQTLRHTTTNKK